MSFLLGKSGSGKSTLLNLISGIDAPSRGDILVEGQSLSGMSEDERTLFRRRHIGFVFQSFNLIPTLTVRDNLLLPLELTGQLDDGQPGKTGRGLLDELGMAHRTDYYPRPAVHRRTATYRGCQGIDPQPVDHSCR